MSYEDMIKRLREEISNRITHRVRSNRWAFAKLGLDRFYIAGGALLPPEPNDYDLFPVEEHDFDKFFSRERGKRILPEHTAKVWETSNAITYDIDGVKIQLCKFWNDSLKDTVERFDFSHCKVGVKFKRYRHKSPNVETEHPMFLPEELYVSDDFIKYRLLGYSEYTGIQKEDYPLSSLLRVFKYIKKGYIKSPYDVVFKILEALLERGYTSEDDFKKQLLAIDIGVDEAEQLDDNAQSLRHIYYLLTGNVIEDMNVFSRDTIIGEEIR